MAQKVIIVNIPFVGQGGGVLAKKLDVPELDKALTDGYRVKAVHQISGQGLTTITFVLDADD